MISSNLRRSSIYVTLLALVAVAYGPILKIGFLWDDHVFIEDNAYIRNWTAINIKHDFISTVSNGQGDAGFLRPVVTWSNRMDYSLWKLRPFGYHLTSLAVHFGNTILLYELILVLGCTPLTALLTACLFAVHPIGVEGLICVTGRATFLSFFFSAAALLFLAEPAPWRIVLALGSFALALLSKEESVVLPFFAALVWFIRGAPRRRYILLLPLFALLCLYLIYRRYLFGAMGVPPETLYTIRFFLQAFPRILSHYIRLILVPWNLHSHRMIMRMSHSWFLSLIGWTSALALTWYKRREYPFVFFCLFWFVIGLLPPALAMVHGGFMLDHWGYWIAPAVLLPLGKVFDILWTRERLARFAMLYFPLLIFYALVVRLNIELRNTDEKMYRWALHFTTSNPIKFNLGALLLQTGRPQEAILYFADYQRIYPEDSRNSYLLATAYEAVGHYQLAYRTLTELLRLNPDYKPAIVALNLLKTKRGLK